jgi:hypothetical protein
MMVTMKNAIFWDVTLCASCKNRCFRGTYCLHHQGDKNRRARKVSGNYQLKHAAMKYYSRYNIPEDGILQA